MDSIQTLICQAAECFGNGNLKSSYQLYLKALDVAVHQLQQVEFVDQYIIAINNYSDVFAIAKSCLQNAQEITLQSATKAKSKPKNPPPPVPVKPLSMTAHRTDQQVPSPAAAPPLPVRPHIVQHAPSPTNTTITPSSNDNNITVWKSIKPVVSPLLPFKNRLFDSSDDDVTIFEDDDEDILDFDNDEKRDECKSRPSIQRQLSVSTVTTVSSQLTAVNPLQAVKKALLTIPFDGKHATGGGQGNEQDGLVLMATGAVDPSCVTKAHTFTSDALTPGTTTTENVPSIPQPPLFIIYKCLQQKLDSLEHRSLSVAEVKASLNKVRTIHMSATTIPTILQFSSALVAYQLTLIDSAIFRNIQPKALLSHSPKSPHPAVVASTDFFNYLTRTIEHSIILQQEASGRAQHIHYWIKVASWCHDLKNFQTLKAIISALGTPPIQRLKRSWAFVPKKSLNRLETLMQLMSEESNYERYRERIDTIIKAGFDHTATSFREPIVPFLGVFLHDMTYLAALTKSAVAASDARITELLDTFSNFQKHPPYSSALAPMCLKDVLKTSKQQRKLALIGGVKNEEESSVEMQQCLATQYLLTRTWVGEKTVDELSLIREPPKTARSCSAIETSAPSSNSVLVLPPSPCYTTGVTEQTHLNGPWSRSGSLSVASGYSSSTVTGASTRPTSLEDNQSSSDLELVTDDKHGGNGGKSNGGGGFWLFGRKSIDHCDHNSSAASRPVIDKKRQRLSRHFSFEDLNVGRKQSNNLTTIFRKEIFWRQSSMSQYSSSSEEMVSPPHPLEPHPSLCKHEHYIV